MRRLILFITILLLGVTCPQAHTQTFQRKYIRHYEKIRNHAPSFGNQGMPLKSERLSNSGGNIVLLYDENLPDSVQTALLAAKKLWESKLTTTQPIFISVAFEPLEDDVAMISEVGYYLKSDMPNLYGCPCALASQIINSQSGGIDAPDGGVFFNSNIDWNCRFSKDAASEYNLPTMTLRGIARCLGFGSSLEETTTDDYVFFEGYPTYFDKLLFCGNTALSSLKESSPEMANFVKSDNVYARTKSQSHKIYAPETFEQNMSLCYFDDDNSIMSYSLGQGNIDLSIDEKTSDILRALGWNVPLSGLPIKCNDISDDGIGSSYEPHTFSLLKDSENVSGYNWKFSLKDKLGNYTQITTGTDENFTIAGIASPDNYYININGDLEGRIECDYTLNGERHSAVPFSISLELRPTILSIDEIAKIDETPYSFALTFVVRYVGADYIDVEVEEEYDTYVRRYTFYEPYLAHVKTGGVSNRFYSWFYVKARNKYGTTIKTLEFAPDPNYTSVPSTIYDDNPDSCDICEISLYGVDGRLIFTGTPSEFKKRDFNQGMYLKEEIYENGLSKKSKILFK